MAVSALNSAVVPTLKKFSELTGTDRLPPERAKRGAFTTPCSPVEASSVLRSP
jgi:hypothetical protein